MIKKNIFQTIRDKEMDRKEFLKYSGLVLLGLVGLKSVISILTQTEGKVNLVETRKEVSRGFGSGKYGQ